MRKGKGTVVLSLMACFALVFSVLSACSNNGGEKDKTAQETQQTQEPQKSGETKTETPNKPPLKLRVALTTGGSKYVEGHTNLNEDPYVKEFEKMTNTDLTFETLLHQEYNQQLSLLVAGGNLPDILQTKGIDQPEISPLVEAGALLPLNDLIDKYAPNLKAKVPKESWQSGRVSKNGVIYGIPGYENSVRNGTVVYLRKDWLDKLGLSVPRTVDEYLTVLRAFRDRDPNGNGQKDEIPIAGREKLSHTTYFFGAYDVLPEGWRLINGVMTPNFIRPEMKDALKLYRQLYEEKLLDQETFTTTGAKWDEKITGKGLGGMWAHAAAYPDTWQQRLEKNVPGAKIVIAPAPVGPSGKPGGVYPIGSSVADFVWTIPKTAKNPEEIVKLFDWFYSDQVNKNFFLYGLEGKDYTVQNGTVKYNYPQTDEDVGRESFHQIWLHWTGPQYQLIDEEFIKGRKYGDLIFDAISLSNKEGQTTDALDMPSLPAVQARPELMWNGLWLEFAAKVITGQESVDKFDAFVEDWKKRGGEQWMKEATDWYNSKKK